MNNKKELLKQILPIVILVLMVFGIVVALVLRDSDGEGDAPKSRVLYGEFYDGEQISYFNTPCIVYDYSGMSDEEFSELCDDIEGLTRKYHRLFDIYHTYPDTVNIKSINDGAGEEIEVSSELYEFLVFCKKMHSLTEGEMNIALGAVLSLWHDCRETAEVGSAALPDEGELSEAMRHTDIEKLLLLDNNRVRLADEKMRLDVGAVGKGYAVNKIAEELLGRGISGVVLDFGGNLRAIGKKPSGDGWSTGITHPRVQGSYITKFEISDTSVVTSGDYERYFTVGDKRYHHIIDKDTGMPARAFSSVTVVTQDSGVADALSTALFCMDSADEVKAAVDKIFEATGKSIRVVLVLADGKTLVDYTAK